MSFDLDYLYNDLAGNPTIVKKTIHGAHTVADATLECQFYPPSNLNTVANFMAAI